MLISDDGISGLLIRTACLEQAIIKDGTTRISVIEDKLIENGEARMAATESYIKSRKWLEITIATAAIGSLIASLIALLFSHVK